MRLLLLLAVPVSLVSTVGCGWDTPRSQPGGKVAVLDLDEIAKRLGRDLTMTEAIRAKEAALNGEVNARAVALDQQLAEQRKQFGPQPKEEQKKELLSMESQARQQLQQFRTKAAASLNQHRLDVIRQFREEVKAVAQRVAAKKGIDLLLTKNDAVVFSCQSAVEITDEITGLMIGANPPLSAAPRAQSGVGIAQR